MRKIKYGEKIKEKRGSRILYMNNPIYFYTLDVTP
ncbi:MAG: hypothetical protein RBG13Loki_0534 [Promethearchaeota archaeon CR_4]|nr:MAG: hypothetical protein RBG13Loki_0534 [Candidatus Lokiarchaeota archaeon CR_4]